MVENLPKPMVIKHVKQDKLDNELKTKSSHLIEKVHGSNVEESFAHLPRRNADVSYCVGKAPLRTRTLK
jgi:hypothetical protein